MLRQTHDALTVESTGLSPEAAIVSWGDHGAMRAECSIVSAEVLGRGTGETGIPISLPESDLYLIASERADADLPALFAVVTGNRALLSWTTPADAARVRIWHNDGSGAVLLAELEAANTYTTTELDAGTHEFAASFLDDLGNESAVGAWAEVEVAGRPLAPEDVEVWISAAVATVGFTAPAGQLAGVIYQLFTNSYPGAELRAAVWTGAAVAQGAASPLLSQPLHAGAWIFGVAAVTPGGVMSRVVEARVALDEDLLPIDPPGAAVLTFAEALAGGLVRVYLEASVAGEIEVLIREEVYPADVDVGLNEIDFGPIDDGAARVELGPIWFDVLIDGTAPDAAALTAVLI